MDSDLRDLLMIWTGAEVEESRREELLRRVRDDAAFRRAFVDEITMLGKLKAVQSSDPRWLRLEDELGWGEEGPSAGLGLEDAVALRLADEPLPRGMRRRRWPRSASAAALLLAVGLGLVLGAWWRRPVPSPRPVPGAGQALAVVVELSGATWDAPTGRPPVVGEMLGPGRLRLRSGRVTLSMLTGVMVVAEGPADIDLVSVDQIYCRQGKLRTRVPPGAEGFVVRSAGSAVVDLGTEFAINLTPEGRARGRVYRGKVEASVLGPGGTPERSQVMPESRSFEIDPGSGTIDTPEGPESYAGPLDLVAPPLGLDPSYRREVLEARPWGYWRFDSLDGGRVRNEVEGGPPLLAVGPVRLSGPASGNRAAVLDGPDLMQYLTPEVPWSPPLRSGYAVELWFLSETIAHAALASLVIPADTNRHSYLLELTSRNRLTLHKPASIRMLHRFPPGESGGDTIFSEPYYLPFRWHHLVGQVRDGRMEVYFDGRPSASLQLTPGDVPGAGQLLFGRLTTSPKTDPGWCRAFRGRLDEIAVYGHPLTPEVVLRHYRLGLPGAR